MGFTPSQVDQMSLWEFAACHEAFKAFHGIEKKPAPMDEATMRELGIEGFD